MKLYEIIANNAVFLTDEDEIANWLEWQSVHLSTIENDGSVDADLGDDTVTCTTGKHGKFVKFNEVKDGAVYYDTNDFKFSGNPFQVLPRKFKRADLSLTLDKRYLTLEGLSDFVDRLRGYVFITSDTLITGSVLSLAAIPGIIMVKFSNDQKEWDDEAPWLPIINANLGNVFKCQQELIDAGLEEFAKL